MAAGVDDLFLELPLEKAKSFVKQRAELTKSRFRRFLLSFLFYLPAFFSQRSSNPSMPR